MGTCLDCLLCKRPKPRPVFITGASAAQYDAWDKWMTLEERKKERETMLNDKEGMLRTEPMFYAWCEAVTLTDAELAILKDAYREGKKQFQDQVDKFGKGEMSYNVDPVRGVTAVYHFCNAVIKDAEDCGYFIQK